MEQCSNLVYAWIPINYYTCTAQFATENQSRSYITFVIIYIYIFFLFWKIVNFGEKRTTNISRAFSEYCLTANRQKYNGKKKYYRCNKNAKKKTLSCISHTENNIPIISLIPIPTFSPLVYDNARPALNSPDTTHLQKKHTPRYS